MLNTIYNFLLDGKIEDQFYQDVPSMALAPLNSSSALSSGLLRFDI